MDSVPPTSARPPPNVARLPVTQLLVIVTDPPNAVSTPPPGPPLASVAVLSLMKLLLMVIAALGLSFPAASVRSCVAADRAAGDGSRGCRADERCIGNSPAAAG